MAYRKKTGYLHGYSKKEQFRLYRQARLLEHYIHDTVNFKNAKQLIEVGCGVGAQTDILLKNFPKLKITGVDASDLQIQQATFHLKRFINSGRVRLQKEDASAMSFSDSSFDSAFLCWFLEHVPDPKKIVREVRRVLKKGAVIYCNEVLNSSFFVEPYSPAIMKYWFLFNDEQWLMHGDPFMGAKLGNVLRETGFKKIETEVKYLFFDSRDKKKRAIYIKEWTELMLSGAPALLKSKRATPALIKQVRKEAATLNKYKDSVLYFSWIQARAVK